MKINSAIDIWGDWIVFQLSEKNEMSLVLIPMIFGDEILRVFCKPYKQVMYEGILYYE